MQLKLGRKQAKTVVCRWYYAPPLRQQEKNGKIDLHWAEQYCKSSDGPKKRIRYELGQEGVYHPDNMLPDGSIYKALS